MTTHASQHRLLVSGQNYRPRHWEALRVAGFETVDVSQYDAASLRIALRTATAYLLGGEEKLTADLLKEAEQLKIVSFVGTGYSTFVDEAAAQRRSITLLNTPGVMATAVAEHTVGLLIGLVRRLFEQNESAKRGRELVGPTTELAASTIGIVGLGAIGSAAAGVLRRGFDCDVVYYSRTRKELLETELGLAFMPLRDVMSYSDAVILQLPTSVTTERMFDESLLKAGKIGQVLVNTGSPRVVDPHALRVALEAEQLRAAAFDGYWIEPLPSVEADPFGLLGMSDGRFVVTPHMAAKTGGTWERMLDLAVDNLVAYARQL